LFQYFDQYCRRHRRHRRRHVHFVPMKNVVGNDDENDVNSNLDPTTNIQLQVRQLTGMVDSLDSYLLLLTKGCY
jgi:hypothetical protein